MRPTRWQYVVASGWLDLAWFGAWALAGAVRAGASCVPPGGAIPADPGFWLHLGVAVLLGFPAGLLAGVLVGWPILGTFYHDQALRNGSPYAKGDTVRVLCGPHRGEVATVCAVWASRGQVRVDLGPAAARACTDVFGEAQVCRADAAGDATVWCFTGG